ncbi:hypothetical protein Q3G72_013804 [Acer saccharum]|nr:hypothetical protein Q3G72_013804 [Acer saccharum]
MAGAERSNQQSKSIVDFDHQKKPKRNKYAFACAILASMTSILLGYDIGVMSGAAIFIKEDLKISDVQVEILVGILNIYSLVGSAAAGRTSDWIGRRYTIVLAAAIFFAGALLMGFSTNYAFLMVGRFVAGIGVGYALMIAPVYTAEVSPASIRGFLTSFPEVFINGGILLGYVSNFALSKLSLRLGWRMMLGIGAIPSVFLGLVILFMPESPRWLVMQGRLGDAKKVLDKTSDSKEEALLRLADIKEAAGIPPECNDDVISVQSKGNRGEGIWKELLIHPTLVVRHILIAGVGIHFFQQASGIDAVVLYSPRIFEKAGITSSNQMLLATIAVGLVKTISILVATFFLDRIGRRPLLLSSVGGMIVSLTTLGFSLTIIDQSHKKLTWAVGLAITTVMSFVAFFSIGLGPITWVYSSEIFPLKLRAQGTSLGVAINRLTSGVISTTFISLYKAMTIGGSFFLFAGIASVAWLFFYMCLPETQGRNLEDMEGIFGNLNWLRDSKAAKKRAAAADRSNRGSSRASNVQLVGGDIGVMSGAAIFIKEDLKISDVQVEILVGILNIYSLVGSAAAGRTSDWIGRRYTIVLAAAIFFAGALLMGFSTNYAFLMVFINGGILLGYVSNFALSKLSLRLGWRMMLGIGAIPSVFLGLVILFMPESPRWLVMQGRLGDAKKVLDNTSDSKEEALLRLADIKEAAGIPPECNDDVISVQSKGNRGEGIWKELLIHPTLVVRHILIAGVGIHFFQQASGIDAVVLYSPRIVEKAGITSSNQMLLATIAVGLVKTISILVATFFLDRIGRRLLLLSSVGGMIVSLTTLGFSLTIIDQSHKKLTWAVGLAITTVMSFVAFFSIGLGPITWVYSSEIFPLKLRAQGQDKRFK